MSTFISLRAFLNGNFSDLISFPRSRRFVLVKFAPSISYFSLFVLRLSRDIFPTFLPHVPSFFVPGLILFLVFFFFSRSSLISSHSLSPFFFFSFIAHLESSSPPVKLFSHSTHADSLLLIHHRPLSFPRFLSLSPENKYFFASWRVSGQLLISIYDQTYAFPRVALAQLVA